MFLDLLNNRESAVDNYFDWFMKKTGKKIPDSDYYDYIEKKNNINIQRRMTMVNDIFK